MVNQVQLIAYADRLAGSLRGLDDLLGGPLAGLFGGVHVLPFFVPYDGADAGFDPVDHEQVDPRLGDWSDVERLSRSVAVTADLVVNHVSSRSSHFVDFVARGDRSPSAGMFLTMDRVFPHGATASDLVQIHRPRPGLPLTPVTLGDGSRRIVWTTFGPDQIDLDIADPGTWAYLEAVLARFAEHGVSTVRLDAVGYTVKRSATSCFMLPETIGVIEELAARVRRRGMRVLAEVHSSVAHQLELAGRIDWVYDFALPPLVLHALTTGDAAPLARWLEVRPANAVTVLDTHDGIGLADVGVDASDPGSGGLLDRGQLAALVGAIERGSGGTAHLARAVTSSDSDVYQVDCTFYDALGRDDRRYLLARLLQLCLPGVPHVYYVGLLAGTNDVSLFERTGVARDLNRHRYQPGEVDAALEQPVVRALIGAIRLRATHPAFAGRFRWALDGPGRLTLAWSRAGDALTLEADLATAEFRLTTGGRGA